LIASYGVAIFVTPTMAYLIFKRSDKVIKESKFRRIFSKLLDSAMKRKYITIAVAIAVFIGVLGMIKGLGLEFFLQLIKILYILI